jgi:hypothetical protein
MVVRASSSICSRVRPGGYVNWTNSTIIGQSPCPFCECLALFGCVYWRDKGSDPAE